MLKTTVKIDRILIIRTDRIGDVVLSLPVVTALRRKYPDAYIAMLVSPAVREIVEDHPDLDEVLLDNGGGLSDFFKLVRKIRLKKFDVAVLLHPTFPLAFALAIAGIPWRIGTGYRFYSILFNKRIFEHRKDSLRHEVDYNLSLASVLGADVSKVDFNFPVLQEALWKIEKLFKEIKITDEKPIVVLHPGSRGSALDWPVSYFAQLANRLVRKSHAQVIVTGGHGEEKVVSEVLKNTSGEVRGIAGRLNLKELAALLKKADLVVANSTGPLHIGVAVGTEVIGFYPPLVPASVRRWGPYRRRMSTFVPDLPECKKCIKSKCPYWNCMKLISVDDVWKRADEKLKGKNLA